MHCTKAVPAVYSGKSTKLSALAIVTTSEKDFQILFVDERLYGELASIKNKYSAIPAIDFAKRRDYTNPYSNLKSGTFMNRASMKIANIDALYHVVKRTGDFQYACIAEGPGGFVQYIQYRHPTATGYGVTLENPDNVLNWAVDKIDMSKFDIDYNDKVNGDILNEYQSFCDYVLETGGYVNLVTADGGIELSDEYARQEYLSARLVFTEMLMAITICARRTDLTLGGSLVLKIFDTTSRMSAETIYVLSRCYREVSIFKPVTSRPANSERYVVCMDMNTESVIDQWKPLLETVQRAYESEVVSSFLPDDYMEDEYIEWLTHNNNESMLEQIRAGKMILDYTTPPSVNLKQCFTAWEIPQPRERKRKVTEVHSRTSIRK